jgi:hypothetical protein
VLLTLVSVVFFGEQQIIDSEALPGIFFLGLGITFGLVGLLPNPDGPMWWAWIPAAVLAGMGLFWMLLGGAVELFNLIWPVILIVFGGFLIFRTVFQRRR